MKKRRIAILTWHYYTNYGSALQAFAIQTIIKKLGYKVKIINYRDPKYGRVNGIKNCIKTFAKQILKALNLCSSYNTFLSFQYKYFNQTKLVQNKLKLPRLCKKFDVVLCGSDQIWAPNVFNPIYMLDFVPDDIVKISYAASIGLNNISENLIDTYRKLLLTFKRISVREKAGADLLREKCSINAEVVLDPTLMLDVQQWKKLEKKADGISGEYIFCYFLNKNHKYKESVLKYAKLNNLKVVGCSANVKDAEWLQLISNNVSPREFLWLIHNAKAILTDSYHATIFSMLYHKDFITFERFENSDEICQNSRIYQLNDYFNISSRIVTPTPELKLEIPRIDYLDFENKLSELRKSSIKFLIDALES